MARISEFEQKDVDTVEIAISADEFARLGSATDPLNLNLSYYDRNGDEVGSVAISTDPADWTLDADTGEYFLTIDTTVLGNHNGDYQGLVLSSENAVGPDTVETAIMVATFGDANAATFAGTVASSSFVPVGTVFTAVEQDVIVGTGTGATVRWDAPDIDTPVVSRVDGLGDTGTAPPVCFTTGTLIETATGLMPVEHLRVGMRIRTQDNGFQTLRWAGHRKIGERELKANPKLRPVLIQAGALGDGLPRRDMRLSRQHRILICSQVAFRMFGTYELLVPAIKLQDIHGISVCETSREVTYFHLLFDQHEVVFAENAPVESLLIAEESIKSLTFQAQAEIEQLFPEVFRGKFTMKPARKIPNAARTMTLIDRLTKNGKSVHGQFSAFRLAG